MLPPPRNCRSLEPSGSVTENGPERVNRARSADACPSSRNSSSRGTSQMARPLPPSTMPPPRTRTQGNDGHGGALVPSSTPASAVVLFWISTTALSPCGGRDRTQGFTPQSNNLSTRSTYTAGACRPVTSIVAHHQPGCPSLASSQLATEATSPRTKGPGHPALSGIGVEAPRLIRGTDSAWEIALEEFRNCRCVKLFDVKVDDTDRAYHGHGSPLPLRTPAGLVAPLRRETCRPPRPCRCRAARGRRNGTTPSTTARRSLD
jgi:hypothetical protein